MIANNCSIGPSLVAEPIIPIFELLSKIFLNIEVMNGAVKVADHKKIGISTTPITIIRKTLPRVTTNNDGVIPIAIKPPNGIIRFPGNKKASIIKQGAKILATDQTSGRLDKKAQSRPIKLILTPYLFK